MVHDPEKGARAAAEIETLVVMALADMLSDSAGLVERFQLAQLDTPQLPSPATFPA
jgi:hypothetical protein